MADLSYKNDAQEDERLNPASTARNLQAAEESNGYANSGIDQAEAFANDPANATKEQEENPNGINYTGSGNTQKQPFNFRGQLKKKGPVGGIIALLLGGGFGLSLLFSPGIALVHLKEVLTDDLNDQFGAMDIRTTHVFKAKLKDMSKGGALCQTTGIRCKFKGMSDRQIKRFKAAGIDVETDGRGLNPLRRNGVKSISFKDSSGTVRKFEGAKGLTQLASNDPIVRNAFRRAFNPKFAGFYDNVSAKILSKYKTSKADKLAGDTDEERNKSVDETIKSGESSTIDRATIATGETADEQNTAKDAQGQYDSQADRIEARSGGVKGVFSGGIKGIGVLGVADSACTVKNTARAVEAGAKVIRAAQLARFAMIFLNFADQVKAGTATPEKAEYIGNKLTAVDTDKTVVDESSPIKNGELQPIKNPDFGKNAFDSDGMKVAMYNDAPILSSRSAQYTVGGGLVGKLASVNDVVDNAPSAKSCKVIQSSGVRLLGGAAGLFLGFVSGGTSLAASIAGSVAVAAALPILESYLKDMFAGQTVTSKTDGVDAGNAIFAGTAALEGDTAAARGMKPQSVGEFKEYIAATKTIEDEYVAMETQDAKNTPFDIYNQYSFLGSFARKLVPATAAVDASPSSSLAAIPKLLSAATIGLLPNAKAVGEFNEERFNKCVDEGYAKLGIDADVFCNVRYGLSAKELAMDTDEVIDYMVTNGYIDAETGLPSPLREEYGKFMDECVNRTAGWGENQAENSGDGSYCVEKTSSLSSEQLSNFRVYTMDNSINEAMEYEGPTTGPNLDIMTYNVRKDELTDSSKRNGPIATLIQERQPAIIGFQEMQQVQATAISKALPDYSYTTSGVGGTRRIFWKTSMFTKIGEGTWHSTKEAGSDTMPWVKLQASNGKILYVFDVHTEPGSSPGAAESQAEDAKHLLEDVIPSATKNDGNPIVVIGDMNSGYPGHDGNGTTSFYTNFTKNNTFTLTFNEAATKLHEDCSTGHDFGEQRCGLKDARHIDHIYVSTSSNASISSWENIANDITSTASDHNPVIVNMSIPGLTTESENAAGSAPVNTDGYAFPVALSGLISGIKVNQTETSHSGGYDGFDLISKGGTPVYAITDGSIVKVNRSYVFDSGKPGKPCESITFKSKDGYYYWYGHVIKSTSKTEGIKAGEKIAEVADKSYGPLCQGGAPHLHIDRNKSRDLAGRQGDPSFIPLLSKIYEAAGGK